MTARKRNRGPEVLTPTAETIYSKLRSFAIPESHAFSFAYLVYASAWLKAQAEDYAGVLAAQPMGWSPLITGR